MTAIVSQFPSRFELHIYEYLVDVYQTINDHNNHIPYNTLHDDIQYFVNFAKQHDIKDPQQTIEQYNHLKFIELAKMFADKIQPREIL